MTTLLFFAIGLMAIQPAPDSTTSIDLEFCYQQVEENYPTTDKIELQKRITDLNVRIANTGYYPDININGKASYQSEVTEFLIPGGSGPPAVSKDQYEASLGITQPVFNGGMVGIRKDLERARGEQEVNSIKVELHQIRTQVDQVYFGILLSQQQAKVNKLLIENLREQVNTIHSRVRNGVLLPSQQYILEAELLKAQQDSISIQSNIKAGYRVLSEIIGEKIEKEVTLKLPKTEVSYQNMQPQRPEYDLFESTRRMIEQQKELADTKKLPSISAFGTAAYGRPGLNFLNDDFHDYYIFGVRLKWNVWDFINSDRENQALQVQQQKVTQNQRAFTRQLNASLDRIRERIVSLRENMDRDKKIIDLRQNIVEESASQLKNGVITATEYITELNQASQARLSLFMNKIRLSQAQSEYATTLGVR